MYCCTKMSDHTCTGRTAARLETMVLVFSSYVLIYVVNKRWWLSLYGCYFLIYVIRRPWSLDISLTRNRMLFNVWFHVRTKVIVGILPSYLISYNKSCRTYGYEKTSQWHHCSIGIFPYPLIQPYNLYLSIRSNRIITNIILFPNSPKYPVSDHNISK